MSKRNLTPVITLDNEEVIAAETQDAVTPDVTDQDVSVDDGASLSVIDPSDSDAIYGPSDDNAATPDNGAAASPDAPAVKADVNVKRAAAKSAWDTFIAPVLTGGKVDDNLVGPTAQAFQGIPRAHGFLDEVSMATLDSLSDDEDDDVAMRARVRVTKARNQVKAAIPATTAPSVRVVDPIEAAKARFDVLTVAIEKAIESLATLQSARVELAGQLGDYEARPVEVPANVTRALEALVKAATTSPDKGGNGVRRSPGTVPSDEANSTAADYVDGARLVHLDRNGNVTATLQLDNGQFSVLFPDGRIVLPAKNSANSAVMTATGGSNQSAYKYWYSQSAVDRRRGK